MNVKNIMTGAAMVVVVGTGLAVCADGASGRVTATDSSKGTWLNKPMVNEGGKSVSAPRGKNTRTFFRPATARTNDVLVAEFDARFEEDYTTAELPEVDIGAVTVVGEPGGRHRFACYDDGAWVTNRTVEAALDTDYTVELTMNSKTMQVSYRVKPKGGAYVPLHVGKMSHLPNGEVGIAEPGGQVKEIRWEDR